MLIKPTNVDQYLQSGCGRCKFGGTPQCKVHSWTEELRLLRESGPHCNVYAENFQRQGLERAVKLTFTYL